MLKLIGNAMKYNFYLAIIICITLTVSCSDFFEEDLESVKVNLLSPADSLQTEKSTLTFWWDEVDGASEYELQVVSPNFKYTESVVLDTTISSNQFQYTLSPGYYEWRVRALNSAYASLYTYHTFQIDSTLDLSGQEISLLRPANDIYSNNPDVIITWMPLYNAKEYHVDIKSPDWETGSYVFTYITPFDSIKITLDDGSFAWGVYASNFNSFSKSSHRNIVVDTEAPVEPVLKLPANGASFTKWPVELSWDKVTDTGSPLTYNVLVTENDSLFNDIKLDTVVSATKLSLDFKDFRTSPYYWKVVTQDKAKNYSDTRKYRRFKVDEN